MFYRDWTVQNARDLGLTGWVMNNADSTVSALLQGEPDTVATMLERMLSGPPAARVDHIDQQECPAEEHSEFHRR